MLHHRAVAQLNTNSFQKRPLPQSLLDSLIIAPGRSPCLNDLFSFCYFLRFLVSPLSMCNIFRIQGRSPIGTLLITENLCLISNALAGGLRPPAKSITIKPKLLYY